MKYELWEGKLPKGWSSSISGHFIAGSPPLYRSYTYQSWYNMLHRCYTTSHPYNPRHYSDVRIWEGFVVGEVGFRAFLTIMGERPEGMTLDRIDPNGHYTPDNIRWSDSKTQAANKRKKAA